jgi:hypothetical protein
MMLGCACQAPQQPANTSITSMLAWHEMTCDRCNLFA